METRLVCFLFKMAANEKVFVLDFIKRFAPVFTVFRKLQKK